jgi:predicted Zn-dependent protease
MSRRRAAQPRPRVSRLLAAGCAVLLLGGVGVWYATRPGVQTLIDQGLAVSRSNPDEGERRLRQLIEAGGPAQSDARLALCTVQARRHAWDQVRKQLALVDLRSVRPDLLYLFGTQALQADRIAIGRRALDTVASRRVAESDEALQALVAHYEDWAENERAITAARALTELDPARARSWATLARALGLAERPQESLAAAREALRREPSSELQRNLKHHIAQQLIGLGEFAAAKQQLDELQENDGDSLNLVRAQIELCRRDGKPEDALKLLNSKFPRTAKPDPATCLQRGQISLELRRFESAARDLEQYLNMNGFDGTAEEKLSEAYRGMGETEKADQHHEHAEFIHAVRARIREVLRQRAANPTDPAPCRQLAVLSSDLGERAAAQRWQERALALERGR